MSRRLLQRVPGRLNGGGDSDNSQNMPNGNDVSTKTKKHSPTRTYTKEQVLEELNAHLQIHAEGLLTASEFEETHNPYDPSPSPIISPGMEKENILQNRNGGHKTPSKIPVMSAHKKRKATARATRGRTLSGLQPVSIHNYRPNYTWNRGGRVKELRIRNIGRKYLYIWIRKVYGRLNPCVARAHYNNNLMRLAFSEWYSVYWTNVKEWRLTVRAECQHRYTLWNKVFQSWKDYVKLNKTKKNKLNFADRHAARKLLKRTFSVWKEQHQFKKARTQLKEFADGHYKKNLQRKAWDNWGHQFQIRQQRKQMEVVALQFWAYRIQIQHWLQWCQAYQERATERYSLLQAGRIYDNGLTRKCFHSLMAYAEVRDFKRSRKEFASKLYCSNLQDRCLTHWHQRFTLRRSLAEHHHKIVELAGQFTLRRTFLRWKHYISLQHKEREKEYMADVHYLRHLLLLGLNGLRLGSVRRRIKDARQQMAADFHYHQILRQTWYKWLSKCEENEELQLLAETQTARQHYRLCVLKKSWQALLQYKLHRQHKQSLWVKAEAFYYWRSLPRYFYRMKVFVQIMKNKGENSVKAEEFRRENVQARFFYQWFVETERSQNERMAERMAILHCEDKQRRRFLKQWQLKTRESLEEQEKLVIAADHHCQALRKTALMQWRDNVRQLKKGQASSVKAAKHLYLQRMKKCFTAWKLFHHRQQKKTYKVNLALSHIRQKLCRAVWSQWRGYVTEQQQLKAEVEKLYRTKCCVLMRNVLHTWHRHVQEILREKDSDQQADVYHNRHLLIKVFKTWHRFAAIHAYKKNETVQLVREGQKVIHTGILRRTFAHWRGARDECLMLKLKYQQAVEHHENSVRIKVLHSWKSFCVLSQRKKLLERQADWFRHTVLRTRCFLCWKQEHQQALEIKFKTNVALWQWCLTLQRNVLVRWWVYTENRKRKKKRQAEALERRRSRILKDGATQWLKVSHEFTQMRAKFAAQQHSKSAYDTYQLVQKYALHWKHVVTNRKMSRQISKEAPQFSQPAERPKIIPSAPVLSLSPVRVPRFDTSSSTDVTVPQLVDSLPVKAARPRPRQPDFLIESLKKDGLLISSPEQHRYSMLTVTENKKDKTEELECPLADENVPVEKNSVVFGGHGDVSDQGLREPFSFPRGNERAEVIDSLSVQPIHEPWKIASQPEPDQKKQKHGRNLPRSTLTTTTQIAHPRAAEISQEPLTSLYAKQSDGNTITLLAPSAFLTKKDGTPISDPHIEACIETVKPESNLRLQQNSVAGNIMLAVAGKGGNSECTVKDNEQSQIEIFQIRDQLKQFDEKKKKLKVLKSQWKQLTAWLGDQSMTEDSLDDRDCRQMKDELLQIDAEMVLLRAEISQEKPKCEGLARRVQDLLKLQHNG